MRKDTSWVWIAVAMVFAVLAILLIAIDSAQATVSPSKQAFMNQQGWTAGADDAYDYGGTLTTVSTSGATGGCAHSRARRAGSAMRYRSGNPMARGAVKLALCANGGRFTAHEALFRHASPGRYWKNDGPWDTDSWWMGNDTFRARGIWYWRYDVPGGVQGEFNSWRLTVQITGHVVRDHQIKFNVIRDWK